MKLYQFPLKQHVGEGAVPSVSVNETVKRGQPLAFAKEDSLSVPIHSSVTGIVREVSTSCVLIEETETNLDTFVPLPDAPTLQLIKDAGIVGLGGAGFPTYAKLTTPIPDGTVIINAAECEPILCHNITRIQKSYAEIMEGLSIVMKLVSATHGILAIKEQHQEEIQLLSKIAPENIRIAPLQNIYPAGEERALIRDTLDILLKPEELPNCANAVILNVETLYRIYEAITFHKPFIDKDITVAGKFKNATKDSLIQVFLDQPLGLETRVLFDKAGELSSDYGELIAGGPFTGKRTSLNTPLLKTTGGLIAAECFPKGPDKIGLLVCACGADETRLRQIAESMQSTVVSVMYCKQAINQNGRYKCENPGHCPGQVQKILEIKKAGATGVLISNCTDCSNTVMSCAPNLSLSVYHCTDQALRAVNSPLIRKIKS